MNRNTVKITLMAICAAIALLIILLTHPLKTEKKEVLCHDSRGAEIVGSTCLQDQISIYNKATWLFIAFFGLASWALFCDLILGGNTL